MYTILITHVIVTQSFLAFRLCQSRIHVVCLFGRSCYPYDRENHKKKISRFFISSFGCESAQGDLTITDMFCNIKVWQCLPCPSYMLTAV